MIKLRYREVKLLAQVHRAESGFEHKNKDLIQWKLILLLSQFIHSLNKYLWSTYSKTGIVQGSGYLEENENLDFSIKDSNLTRQIKNEEG